MKIVFHNATQLSGRRLLSMFEEALNGWAVGTITVRIRYSRAADFSGACFYADRRIHVNIGRHLPFPYALRTNVGRAKARGPHWYRPIYILSLQSPYELVLFVFLHELYHLLVKRARRNTRQKEGMCDRFAARFLVDRYGAEVRTAEGAPVAREVWDFQDLDGFVAAARARRKTRPVTAETRRLSTAAAAARPSTASPRAKRPGRGAADERQLELPFSIRDRLC